MGDSFYVDGKWRGDSVGGTGALSCGGGDKGLGRSSSGGGNGGIGRSFGNVFQIAYRGGAGAMQFVPANVRGQFHLGHLHGGRVVYESQPNLVASLRSDVFSPPSLCFFIS